MSRAVERFLRNEERASSIVIWSAAAVIGVCTLCAVGAVVLL